MVGGCCDFLGISGDQLFSSGKIVEMWYLSVKVRYGAFSLSQHFDELHSYRSADCLFLARSTEDMLICGVKQTVFYC